MAIMIEHKRGDTFSRAGPGTLPSGTWTASAQVRTKKNNDAVLSDLVVALAPYSGPQPPAPAAALTHVLSLSLDAAKTALWPIDELECDVEFRDASGIVRSTQTFGIKCVKDITRA